MALSSEATNKIAELLTITIREKLNSYKRETKHMPFHCRLLGEDRYAMFSFIHSMNTTFGMSIWEQIGEILAKGAGNYAKRQYSLLGEINGEAEKIIQEIYYKLRKDEISVNKMDEIKQIKQKIKRGTPKKDPDSKVDFFVKIGEEENYFDITTAKPNMKEFVALKLKLLRWTGLRLSQDTSAKVFTRLAIPYNPYHPEPYERWTLKGLYDLEFGEILVGEEFWNFISNDNIYAELLDVFQDVGEKLRGEIDAKFAEFRR